MIRSEAEYKRAVKRLTAEALHIQEEKERLEKEGLTPEEVKNLIDPLRTFHAQYAEEVECYQRLKRGEFDELRNFQGLGKLLISLRISAGLSQRELAKRLDVDESQVCRDERNEYHGSGVDKVNAILEALGARLKTVVEEAPKAA